jgi:hypothetical protein
MTGEKRMKKLLLLGFLVALPDLFWGTVKIGIGCWGFSQKNAYGNISGSLITLSGAKQLICIKW